MNAIARMGPARDRLLRVDRRNLIAIYLPSLAGGGAERVMIAIGNGLSERGHRVDLVLARADGPYLIELSEDVRVVDLARSRVLASVPRLAAYLRREKPSVLLSAMSHANIAAVVARALSPGARLVVSERDAPHSGHRRLADRLMPGLARLAYPRADHVVAVSRALADDLVARCRLEPAKVSCIYNPLNRSEIDQLACAPIDDRADGLAQDRPLILAAGRLVPQKDFALLIRAFAHLRHGRDAQLAILGEGPERARLNSLAVQLGVADDLLLPGFIQNPFPWMRRATVFALSSLHEGLPNVLLQALACGAAVVSTDCPTGPAEILDGGRIGRLVPVGDAEAMARALDDTLIEGRPSTSPDLSRFDRATVLDAYERVLLK